MHHLLISFHRIIKGKAYVCEYTRDTNMKTYNKKFKPNRKTFSKLWDKN